MDWDVGVALLLSAFCVVAPTVLYVGLVRGLDRLRDDPFVEQVLLRADEYETGGGDGTDAGEGAWRAFAPSLPASDSGRASGRDGTAVSGGPTCPRCGAPNPEHARFCDVCLAELPE